MTNQSRIVMARIKRKLTKWEKLSLAADGHAGEMFKAKMVLWDAEQEIKDEFNRLGDLVFDLSRESSGVIRQ